MPVAGRALKLMDLVERGERDVVLALRSLLAVMRPCPTTQGGKKRRHADVRSVSRALDELVRGIHRSSTNKRRKRHEDDYVDNYVRAKCDICRKEGEIYLGHARSGSSMWEAVIGLCLKCGGKPTKCSHLDTVERPDLIYSDSDIESAASSK